MATIYDLPNLQATLEPEIDANDYAVGAVPRQGGRLVCYHSKTSAGSVLNFNPYDKELNALVIAVKKCKYYFLGKETSVHVDHEALQYLQAQSVIVPITYEWDYFSLSCGHEGLQYLQA